MSYRKKEKCDVQAFRKVITALLVDAENALLALEERLLDDFADTLVDIAIVTCDNATFIARELTHAHYKSLRRSTF